MTMLTCALLVAAALRPPDYVSAKALLTSDLGRVLVTWTTPGCTYTSGLIDSFIVEYCIVSSRSNCTGNMSRVAVPAVNESDARREYVVTGLKYGTEYGFRICSSYNARKSNYSTFVFVTTAQNELPFEMVTGLIIAAVVLLLLLSTAASFVRFLRTPNIGIRPPRMNNETNNEDVDLLKVPEPEYKPQYYQMTDVSQKCPLMDEDFDQRTRSATIPSTGSEDSGFEINDSLPRRVQPLVVDTNPAATKDGYVVLNDAMSCKTTSTTSTQLSPVMSPTDDDVASTDDDDRSVSPVDEHLLPRVDVDAESVSQPDADKRASHVDHDLSPTTAEMCSKLSGEDESRSTTATRPLDTSQPDHTQPQSSATDNAYCPYITLSQLPSNGVLDDRLHSNDLAT